MVLYDRVLVQYAILTQLYGAPTGAMQRAFRGGSVCVYLGSCVCTKQYSYVGRIHLGVHYQFELNSN